MEEGEVVFVKVFDKWVGDVVFEGKVSTDVQPDELVKLGCFLEQSLDAIYINETEEEVKSFKGLQDHVELVARSLGNEKCDFSGVLYVGAEDKVLRKSERVPLRECLVMSVWELSHEECMNAFKCETLEVLEINWCTLLSVPNYIGKMTKLKKLSFFGLMEVKSIPEEIGELSNLKELRIGRCGIESLPKRLKELKMLKSLCLMDLRSLELHTWDAEDVFSKLNQLTIRDCKTLAAPFAKSFWSMIKSTTDLRLLDLNWDWQRRAETVAALKVNGSINDEKHCFFYKEDFFKRNKENHERAMECVVHLMAIRRWRNELNNVPKEMVKMIAMMLWNTKCDVGAWSKKWDDK